MDTLSLKLLTKYFEFKVVFGARLTNDDAKKIFDRLAEVYMIDSETGKRLFELAESPDAEYIGDEEGYRQFKRIEQFLRMTKDEFVMSDEMRAVIEVKGQAIYNAADADLAGSRRNSSSGEAINKVFLSARLGSMTALFMRAVIQMEGLLSDVDLEDGIKTVRLLSRWVSADGLLLALYYDRDNAVDYLNRLYTVTDNMPDAEVFYRAKEVYGPNIVAHKHAGMDILMKAVARKRISQMKYDDKYARIAFSPVMNFADKQSVLLFEGGREIADVSGLPLRMSNLPEPLARVGEFKTPLNRVEEQNKVEKLIFGNKFMMLSRLCFYCNDRYVLGQYAEAVERSTDGNVITIRPSELTSEDIKGNPANAFVRSLDEKRKNTLLIMADGNIPDPVFAQLSVFFQDEDKRNFRLSQLNIEIDMGAINVIVFADKRNAQTFKSVCNMVPLKALNAAEKRAEVDRVLKDVANKVGVTAYEIEPEAADMLCNGDMTDIDGAVVRLLQKVSLSEGETIIKKSDVIELSPAFNHSYGFGGD